MAGRGQLGGGPGIGGRLEGDREITETAIVMVLCVNEVFVVGMLG